jgi:hypothetical protein
MSTTRFLMLLNIAYITYAGNSRFGGVSREIGAAPHGAGRNSSCKWIGVGKSLPFGVLGRSSGPLEAVLLALLDPRVPGKEAVLPEDEPEALVRDQQGASNAVA